MFKLKYMNNIYEEAARAVSFAESSVRYCQREINFATSRLPDLQGENGEKFANRRRWSMKADGVCDFYDEFGHMAYMSADDLRREAESKIYRLKKKLASAKEEVAKKQAELERVRLFLAEEEARIFPPVVEEEEDDEDDLVF